MKYNRREYAALARALDEVAQARACIAENRGPDKEQAREAYEYVVGQVLVPALTNALDLATGDLDARDVERTAEALLKLLVRKGVVVES